MRERFLFACLVLLEHLVALHAFQGPSTSLVLRRPFPQPLGLSQPKRPAATKSNSNETGDDSSTSPDQEYRNAATKVLSRFMSSSPNEQVDPLRNGSIDWDAPKIPKVPIDKLAQALDAELYEKEWFVTGRVNPRYFSDQFRFQDPDVQVTGIEKYAQGVRKIFNQETARAEIISTIVSDDKPNTITCTWRLSGKVDIGPGLTIKPYIVYTDFIIDEETGLVIFQEDRFDLPGWDILLSAFFPFLIGKLTADPAPTPGPRDPPPTVPPGVLSSSLQESNSRRPMNLLFPWLK